MPRAFATTACLLAAFVCHPVIADDDGSAAPQSVEELLGYRLHTGKGETFRVFPLSSTVFYAVFDSNQTRARVFEGVDPDLLAALASPASLTLALAQLTSAYQAIGGTLAGDAREFRDALAEAGFLDPGEPAAEPPAERRVLLTMIQSASVRKVLDFSMSERQEFLTQGFQNLAAPRGNRLQEQELIQEFGPDGTRSAVFDVWRFDRQPDELRQRKETLAREREIFEARRARLFHELVHALAYLDPEFEPAAIHWIEGLDDERRRLLVQLLQLAGYEQIDAPTLVREAPAHLCDPRVMAARLFHRLESVTQPPGVKGLRKLDPEQFPDPDLLARAERFYARFFVVHRGGRFALALREEIWSFLDDQAAACRDLAAPFLADRLPESWPEQLG